MLKPFFREFDGNIDPDAVCFDGASFDPHNPQGGLKIKVNLNGRLSSGIFDMLGKKIKEETDKEAVFKIRFAPEIKGGWLVSEYWKYMAHESGEMRIWLEHTKGRFENDAVYITCDNDFIFGKITPEKNKKGIKRMVARYFGIEADVIIEKSTTDAPVKKKQELSGSNIRITGSKKKTFKSRLIGELPQGGRETAIEDIFEAGKYVIEGYIFTDDRYKRELKNKKGTYLLTFYITNNIDTIKIIAFAESWDAAVEMIPDMGYVKAGIDVMFDEREGELTGKARKLCSIEKKEKKDTAAEKRIELHAHTKMSAMDAVMSVKDYIHTASEWGHKAAAVTDHGVIHSFPEAYKTAQKAGIKLIMGTEGYLVNDSDDFKNKNTKPYHIIILVANKTGLRNLYKIVSLSHIEYFYKNPRIYRKIINENREGLLLGTACYLGEMYQAVLKGENDKKIKEIAEFYDYFEIQPDTNNEFLIREGRVKDMEELHDINKKICGYGELYSKPVIATCDVHFLSKSDRKFREVIMLAMGYDEAKAELYFRTTDEMLEEFSYLGSAKAKEVVVSNPEKINQMIDSGIQPVPDKLFPPEIENSDKVIKEAALKRTRELYGGLPAENIKKRIDKEMDTIMKRNYSILYFIAGRMVEKSKKDGYVVGSRGSVGSSMVAFLCGISEVNPMAAHYRCGECFFTEFPETDLAGIDLPGKKCPKCGKELERDGFNIPFETFLGFDGEKIPDIDLNFSGEYQEEIHRFVRELFGEDKVYKAGTISTLKTQALKKDFMGKYMLKTGAKPRKAEQQRLVNGCLGIKRSTGQHPGGLMLVPADKEIYDFTPIQWSPKKDSITTHFDYSWIHDALVKIDALGHDMPTSLKRICEGIGKKVDDIPLDDPVTMKLFSGIKVLGVNPENYDVPVGTLGVPEFGTAFVREMLHFSKPKTFSELVYISGLSHGTDVWLGNAKELIKNKITDLKNVISVRDDIMNYLMKNGIDSKTAFEITEFVRKGRGLKPEWETIMRKNKIPEWYIDSCKKIKYMFPKAHAVAYTMMSVRIAYIKKHYPVYFYADYYNRSKEGFEYEFMDMNMDSIKKRIRESKCNINADKKEKDRIKVLEVLFEMKERGIEFVPLDLYESDPDVFKVKKEKIIPPLSVMPELGKQAAKLIESERRKEPFSSVEEFKKRTGVNKNVLEFMKTNGYLNDMPESDQTVLF